MNANPNPPPPDEQESRITALLLGELSPREADETRRAIEREPELGRLHDRLRQTIGRLQEALAQPTGATHDTLDAARLSDERRRELLQRFGKGMPSPVVTVARRESPWFVPMSLAAGLIALIGVGTLVLPSLPSRDQRMMAYQRASLEMLREEASEESASERTESSSPRSLDRSVRGSGTSRPPADLDVAFSDPAQRRAGIATTTGEGGGFGGGGRGAGTAVDALSVEDRSTIDGLMLERYGIVPSRTRRLDETTGALDQRSKALALGDVPVLGRLPKLEPPAPPPAGRAPLREAIGVQGGTAPRLGEVEAQGGSAGYVGHSHTPQALAPSGPSEEAIVQIVRTSVLERDRLEEPERRVRVDPVTGQIWDAVHGRFVQPERVVRENPFSTFSLNVSDVSFKLTAASLETGTLPDPAGIRTEEFINAFDYRDPEPMPGMPLAFAYELAAHPFAHNRELIRFAVKTAAQGREPGRALNLVLLLDNSGSMERADRVAIIREALGVLSYQLEPQDKISVVAFARTARLWIDGLPGDQAGELVERVGNLTPQGGTHLEDALRLGYETARRHYLADGVNRVILLTDGAANLGNVEPDPLKQIVETHRRQGIALDCFGIGWEGYNDDLLEVLARHGDGRYGFVNTPEEASTGFADQLAGALHVAAADVKVQIEFNPDRVIAYRQIGYEKHQLAQEQFRDNTVDAAEIGAAESGNALYAVQFDPQGRGPIAVARVRFKVPATGEYQEHEWLVPYQGRSPALIEAGPAMRLACVAAMFAEWLALSPYAAEVTTHQLLALLQDVPESYDPDRRPARLEWMIRQAQGLGRR